MNLRHEIFILCFFFCIQFIHAQDWLWAFSAGGTSADAAYSIATDEDGNLYLTGYFGSDSIRFGSTILESLGGYDVFIAKYNDKGEALWARSAGSSGNDFGFSIAVDPTGNVCLTGSFQNDSLHIGPFILENKGGNDVFVAKYDALGNVLWAKSAGGAQDDDAYGIATDDQANIYITGRMTSPSITFDTSIAFNSNQGFAEIFLVKFEAGGNVAWARTAAGSNNDEAYSVTTGSSGDVYITGFFRSLTIGFGNKLLLNTSPAREMFVAKFSFDGDVIWAKKAGGDLNDLAYSIRMLPGDNLMVSGSFRSDSIIFGNTVLKNTQTGALDFFLTRYDTSGQAIAAVGGGGIFDDHAFCTTGDISNSHFLAGGYLSPEMVLSNGPLINHGDSTYDMFILKYDPAGNILWSESIGGSEDDYINWLSPLTNNSIYIVGYFSSPSVTFGKTTLLNKGGGDLFIAKLETSSVAVRDIVQDQNRLWVYPNPAHESFTVELKDSESQSIIGVYNTMGDSFYERNFTGKQELNIGSDLNVGTGLYFISITNKNQQFIKKLIIQ